MRIKLFFCFKFFFLFFIIICVIFIFFFCVIEFVDKEVVGRIYNNKRDIKFVVFKFMFIGSIKRFEQGFFVELGIVEFYVGFMEDIIFEFFVRGFGQGVGMFYVRGQRFLSYEVEFEEIFKYFFGKCFKIFLFVSVYYNNFLNGFWQWDFFLVGLLNSFFENEFKVWKEFFFENFKLKYMMVYGEFYEGSFDIRVFIKKLKSCRFFVKIDERIGKLIYVCVWEFDFKMWGEEEFFWVVYEFGIGMRNFYGFGMVEVI